MIRAFLFTVALLLAWAAQASIPAGAPAASSWWEQSIWDKPDREYQWYPPDPPPKKEEKKRDTKKGETPPKRDIRQMTTTKEVREELERLRDIAVMNPTPQNLRAFLEANKYVMEKSAVFADVARRVIWATPEIDYTLRRPSATAGVWLMRDLKEQVKRDTVTDIMRTHGVFFFLRSDCPYCHKQAEILRYLEHFYGLEVFPVSLDGGGTEQYPRPRQDNGIARVLGVTTVPALFLMPRNPAPGTMPQPIGYGLLSAEEIISRIHTLTRTQPGDEF